ncbi:Mid1-interacting protein 1A [Trichinella nelsoni]|uniref:Mid1-interacting protein 1A n=1 Tax=Trichinella nelsoni TaxID=6336 RepID=A0A0V0RPG3_9BILA|nr:Mid1-interacting protein 1A [Trichinella nelsoni]
MDRLNNNGGRGQVLCLSQGECTTRSIVKALDNFLTAVQRMKDTVMVPSRLIDMTTSVGELREALNSPQEPNALVAIPSNMVTSSFPLYSFYQMLQMIRNQLVSGPEADDANSDENGADEQCRHLSHAFQQHLQGLFSVLRQLTDTANYLTKRYQDELFRKATLCFFNYSMLVDSGGPNNKVFYFIPENHIYTILTVHLSISIFIWHFASTF